MTSSPPALHLGLPASSAPDLPSNAPLLLPRPPGVFPDDFPPNCHLRRAPTPGKPLAPEEQCPHLVASSPRPRTPTTAPISPPVDGTPMAKSWRELTSGGHTPTQAPLPSQTAGFPPVDCVPPALPNAPKLYPSGNSAGTAEFPPFEATLRDLLFQSSP
jgi:hypothetical protein